MTSKNPKRGVNQIDEDYEEDMENDFYEDNEFEEGPFTAEEQEQQLETSKIVD